MVDNTLSLNQDAIELANDHYQSLALGFYRAGVPLSSELIKKIIPGLVFGFLIARRELSPPPTVSTRHSVKIEDGVDTHWVTRSYRDQFLRCLDSRSSFLLRELRRAPSLDEKSSSPAGDSGTAEQRKGGSPGTQSPKQIISAWQERTGLPLEKLAEKAGLSLSTVSRVKNGTSMVKIGTLMDLAEAMGLGRDNWPLLRWSTEESSTLE